MRRSISSLCALTVCALFLLSPGARAEPPPDDEPVVPGAPRDAPETPAPRRVGVVTGNEVNLRTGPSVDFHEAGSARRGDLLILVPEPEGADPADGVDFRRVIVPGGPVVYVFASLVEWTEGELEGTVRADRVLIRATPSKAHYPVHDQRLERDDVVIVLERVAGPPDASGEPGGDWLRIVAPERVHLWMHRDFIGDSGDERQKRGALVAIAERRLDALTGGRAAERREVRERERIEKFVAAVKELEDRLAGDKPQEADADRAAELSREAPDAKLRERALAVERGVREEFHRRRVAELERNAAAATREAEARKRELEEREREYRRRMEELEQKRADPRGRPAAEGVVGRGSKGDMLRLADGTVLRLRSLRFRLRDYTGKRVRVWGTREKGGDQLEVTSIEILAAD